MEAMKMPGKARSSEEISAKTRWIGTRAKPSFRDLNWQDRAHKPARQEGQGTVSRCQCLGAWMGEAEKLWEPKQQETMGSSWANLTARVFMKACFFTCCHWTLSGSFIVRCEEAERLFGIKLAGRVRTLYIGSCWLSQKNSLQVMEYYHNPVAPQTSSHHFVLKINLPLW